MINGPYSSVATDSPTSFSDNDIELQFSLKSLESISKEEMTSSSRKQWEEFPGKNYFCCDGRIITSRQPGLFIFTCFLIIATSVSFFIFDCPYIWSNVSPIIPLFDAFVFLLVIGTLFRTSFSDPGILPRATLDEAADIEKQIEIINTKSGTTSYRPPPRTKDIYIRGQLVKVKFCFTCKIFRPPRACHCSICDNCVERFDHHCPWVGNCVGSRNYRYFYWFLVFLALHCVIIFASIIAHLILDSKDDGFVFSLKKSPASVIELVICFFAMWSIVGLAGFHTYLIILNMTTNEEIKGSYSTKSTNGDLNPYRLESVVANYCSVVCGPIPPSVLNLRKLVKSSSSFELMPRHDKYEEDDLNASLVAFKDGISSNPTEVIISQPNNVNNEEVNLVISDETK